MKYLLVNIDLKVIQMEKQVNVHVNNSDKTILFDKVEFLNVTRVPYILVQTDFHEIAIVKNILSYFIIVFFRFCIRADR